MFSFFDNSENHVAITKEDGIQALLRFGHTCTTDNELRYQAALTAGSLASNAAKMLPRTGVPGGAASAEAGGGSGGGGGGGGSGSGKGGAGGVGTAAAMGSKQHGM